MANGSGAAVAGLIVGIIIVSQAGGPEGDTGKDREPEVPRAVEGGLATSHTDDLAARIGSGVSIPVNPLVDDQVCSSVFDHSWHSLHMSTRHPPSIMSWPRTR